MKLLISIIVAFLFIGCTPEPKVITKPIKLPVLQEPRDITYKYFITNDNMVIMTLDDYTLVASALIERGIAFNQCMDIIFQNNKLADNNTSKE